MEARLWNLTPYELGRSPHPIVTQGVVHTTGRLLESELQCAICLDVLRNTRTTKDCLHRFCEECIEKALRSGNKECPSCRTKLISMRSLRADPLFDGIIQAIFAKKRDSGDSSSPCSLRTSSEYRGQRDARNRVAGGPIRAHGSTSAEFPLLMKLEVFPYLQKVQKSAHLLKNWHPRRRLLRVDSSAAGSHVCRYILSRLIVENQTSSSVDTAALDISGMELYVRLDKDTYKLITDLRLSLKDIHESYWKIVRPMQLSFAFKENFTLNGSASPRN